MVSGKRALKKVIWQNSAALLAVLILVLSQPGSSVHGNRASFVTSDVLSSFPGIDPDRFAPGDILLRRGSSLASAMIAKAFPDARQMSHCGILVRDDGEWKVIHSISGKIDDRDGVRMDPVADFLARAKPGMAFHIRPAFPVDRSRVEQSGLRYLNLGSPFDHDYDLRDSGKLYCSELIRAAYLDAGSEDVFHYIRLGGKDLVDIGSFFDPRLWEFGP